ncbi:MAG: hypothetical protein IKO61_02990 [Lachnospiraceae bacterium]|nr:hypothetical protein [Lachnospiraceae bacterium]
MDEESFVFDVAYSGGLLHINNKNMTEILLDIIALFFICGMLIYTRVYRKRGRLCDKLFFVMLILNAAMAVSDAAISLLNQSSVSCTGILVRIFGTLLYLTITFECYAYVLYLMSLLVKGETVVGKYYKPAAVPALVMTILIIANIFGEFIFYVDPRAGAFTPSDLISVVEMGDGHSFDRDSGVGAFNIAGYFYLFIIGLVIYLIIGQILFWKVNKIGIVMFGIYGIFVYFLNKIMSGISMASILFAVILIYTLVGAMNRAFFKEQGGEKDVE